MTSLALDFAKISLKHMIEKLVACVDITRLKEWYDFEWSI